MSKEEKVNEAVEPEEKKEEPIGVTLSKAKADIMVSILQIQNDYGFPAYLTDLLVTAALAEIRDCANKDLIHSIN